MAGFGEPGSPLGRSAFRFGLTAGAGALVAFVALLGLRQLGTVLMMLVAATFLAIGLDRPVAALTRRGLPRRAAVAIVAGATVLTAGGAIALLVPVLADQVGAFFAALPGLLDDVPGDLAAELTGRVTPATAARLTTGLATGAASLAGALFIGVTTAILTLFVLASLDRLRTSAYRLVVRTRRERVRRLGEAAVQKVGGYLVGALGIAAIAGTATLLYTLIAGLPYAFLLAVVVAVCDLVPQIGATIGATVVVLVALSESLTLALVTIAFFLCYQGVENWVVYPRVMSRAVKISNLAAIVAALVGGTLFGVLGVLVAVPAYASIQLVVREVVFPRQDAR